MPGKGSYGPGGKWIYDRAKRLRSKNPDMEESTSFAIATQQAHKVGKSPKRFRTTEGVRTVRQKFSGPKDDYQKTASWAAAARLGAGLFLGSLLWDSLGSDEKRDLRSRAKDVTGGGPMPPIVIAPGKEQRDVVEREMSNADPDFRGVMGDLFKRPEDLERERRIRREDQMWKGASRIKKLMAVQRLAKKGMRQKETDQPKLASEQLVGGIADGKPDDKYPADQLRMGIKVEREHTDSEAKAKEIAKDHLEEHPRYYTALKAMEEKLEKSGGRRAMYHSKEDFERAIVKVATQTGDDEGHVVKGKQKDDVPELLRSEDPTELSSGAEKAHKENREGGYLQEAFSGFGEAAKQTGKDLKEALDHFDGKAVSSKATTNAAQTKLSSVRSAAFTDELRKIIQGQQ